MTSISDLQSRIFLPRTVCRAKYLHSELRCFVVGVEFLPRRKRQQGDVACPLDGCCQAALVRCADSGQPARNDLAALSHKLAQQADVFVVDVVDLLHAKLAHLLAAEKLASAIAAARTTIGPRTIRPTAFSSAMWPWCWC